MNQLIEQGALRIGALLQDISQRRPGGRLLARRKPDRNSSCALRGRHGFHSAQSASSLSLHYGRLDLPCRSLAVLAHRLATHASCPRLSMMLLAVGIAGVRAAIVGKCAAGFGQHFSSGRSLARSPAGQPGNQVGLVFV